MSRILLLTSELSNATDLWHVIILLPIIEDAWAACINCHNASRYIVRQKKRPRKTTMKMFFVSRALSIRPKTRYSLWNLIFDTPNLPHRIAADLLLFMFYMICQLGKGLISNKSRGEKNRFLLSEFNHLQVLLASVCVWILWLGKFLGSLWYKIRFQLIFFLIPVTFVAFSATIWKFV